jgi:hypothetical protein
VTTTEPDGVWLAIPDGYTAMPLDDIAATIDITSRLIAELGTPQQRQASGYVLGSLGVLLQTLADRRAVYCGLGRHRSALDGRLITSTLVVTLLEFPGERNPRLILKDLFQAKAQAYETGRTDLAELPNGPALFNEHTRMLPTPAIPGEHPLTQGAESAVWQLEAHVPSREGGKLATMELSTPFPDHGPQYRTMVVTTAAGIRFTAPEAPDPLAALLG